MSMHVYQRESSGSIQCEGHRYGSTRCHLLHALESNERLLRGRPKIQSRFRERVGMDAGLGTRVTVGERVRVSVGVRDPASKQQNNVVTRNGADVGQGDCSG